MIRIAKQRHERGIALVEFAFVAPILFLTLVAILDAGRMVYINNALSEGAREGARWGAVQGRAETLGGRASIAAELQTRLVGVPAPDIDITCEDLGPTQGCGSGDILVVTVSAAVQPITPLVGQLIGPIDLTSTTRMTIH